MFIYLSMYRNKENASAVFTDRDASWQPNSVKRNKADIIASLRDPIYIKFKTRQKELLVLGRKAVVIAGCGERWVEGDFSGDDGFVLLLGHGWFSWWRSTWLGVHSTECLCMPAPHHQQGSLKKILSYFIQTGTYPELSVGSEVTQNFWAVFGSLYLPQ